MICGVRRLATAFPQAACRRLPASHRARSRSAAADAEWRRQATAPHDISGPLVWLVNHEDTKNTNGLNQFDLSHVNDVA